MMAMLQAERWSCLVVLPIGISIGRPINFRSCCPCGLGKLLYGIDPERTVVVFYGQCFTLGSIMRFHMFWKICSSAFYCLASNVEIRQMVSLLISSMFSSPLLLSCNYEHPLLESYPLLFSVIYVTICS